MAKLLSGKEVAQAMNARLVERVETLVEAGVTPKLAIVRCGEKPSDLSYERGARKRAEALGVLIDTRVLPADVDAEAVIDCIRGLNADETVHGVLLFRPLPKPLRPREAEIRNALVPEKDVDGMTDLSYAGVYSGRDDLGFPPCTARACIELMDHYGIDCAGKRVTVIGRSLVVGRPLSMLLLARHATVTICHTRTTDVPAEARRADILVSTAGELNVVTKDCVRPGQVVIDVSVNWDPNKPNAKGGLGAMAGDAAFDEVEPVVDAITPVPGGVGAVTTAVLLGHVITSAERKLGEAF